MAPLPPLTTPMDECITSHNPDLTQFSIIKPGHPGRLEKADLGEKKNAVGALVTC